jgi:hypothetical protein
MARRERAAGVEWRRAGDERMTMLGGTPWLAVQLLILLGALVVAVIALVRTFRR